jgi:monofunctional biosynthetic peptidoglycan transglycosylase
MMPSQVQSVGILLGDKKPGPFEILIDWINVE